ncbi:MAG: hypothetical protein H0W34_07210 [Pyrinomonadaceae bacterium]|nr:hypothetical protein [Pyrinomonadaceae bacterium]
MFAAIDDLDRQFGEAVRLRVNQFSQNLGHSFIRPLKDSFDEQVMIERVWAFFHDLDQPFHAVRLFDPPDFIFASSVLLSHKVRDDGHQLRLKHDVVEQTLRCGSNHRIGDEELLIEIGRAVITDFAWSEQVVV